MFRINLLRSKWGWNKPLFANIVVVLLLISVILFAKPTDQQVLDTLQKSDTDVPLVEMNGFLPRYMIDLEDKLPQLISQGKSLDGIDTNRSLLVVSHEDELFFGNTSSPARIYYVEQEDWLALGANENTTVIVNNFEEQFQKENNTIYSSFEERTIEFSSDQVMEAILLNDAMFGTYSGYSGRPYLIQPLDDLETKIYGEEISEEDWIDAVWQVSFNLFLDDTQLKRYSSIDMLEDQSVYIENSITDLWNEVYPYSGNNFNNFVPLLERAYSIQRSGFNVIEYLLYQFIPLLILLQFFVLYFLYQSITEKRKRLDLLYVRGESFSKLALSFVSWTTLVPTGIAVILGGIGIFWFGPAKEPLGSDATGLFFMWITIQFPTMIFLSLREIRLLRIRIVTHRSIQIPNIPIKIWHFTIPMALYCLVLLYKVIKRYQERDFTGDPDVLFRLPLYYTWASFLTFITILGIIFYIFESYLGKTKINNISTRLSLRIIRSRIIVACLVIGLTFMIGSELTAGTYYDTHNRESQLEMEYDYSVTFFSHNTDIESLLHNQPSWEEMNRYGATFPKFSYRTNIYSESAGINFSISAFVVNQTFYNNYLAQFDIEPSNLTGKLWISEKLGNYVQANDLSPVISSRKFNTSEFLITPPDVRNTFGSDHYIVMNLQTWENWDLEFPTSEEFPSGRLQLLIETDQDVSKITITNWVASTYQVDTQTFYVYHHQPSLRFDWPNTIWHNRYVQLSMYAIVVGTLIAFLWLGGVSFNNDLNLVNTRYGMNLKKDSQNKLILISTGFIIVGLLGGVLIGFTDYLRTSGLFSIDGLEMQQSYDFGELILGCLLYVIEVILFLFGSRLLINKVKRTP